MNKKLFKSILLLVAFTLILVICVVRIDSILGFIRMIFGVLTPVWIALPLALILNQPYNFMNSRFSKLAARIKEKRKQKKDSKYSVVKGKDDLKKKKIRKKSKRTVSSVLALVITYVIFLFILVVILTFVVPQVFETVVKLIGNVRDYTTAIADFIGKIDMPVLSKYIDPVELTSILQKVITSTLEQALTYSQQIIAVTGNIVSQIINIGLGIIFSIYLILFKGEIKSAGSRLLKAYAPQRVTNVIKSTLRFSADVLANYLLDRVSKSMIISLLLFTGFNIVGMEYSLFIAVVTGICCLLPVFGAVIGMLILALLVFLLNPAYMIFALIYSFVIILCTNLFIVRFIMKNDTVKLHPVIVIVSAFAGAVLGRFVGILLSIPVAVILSHLLHLLVEWINKRSNKNAVSPNEGSDDNKVADSVSEYPNEKENNK